MRQKRLIGVAAALVVALGSPFALVQTARADTLEDLYGTTVDISDFYDIEYRESQGAEAVNAISDEEVSLMSDDVEGEESSPQTRAASTIKPLALSGPILSHLKYESGQNYDQGLSSGDGYHALGYFQFDNRYTLGPFLESVYAYNPTTYSCLKIIGEKYSWDVTGDTRKDGAFTELGNDLNTAWHAAYKASPTEFSQLQNYWAYTQYYSGAAGVKGSLEAMGIDIDSRPDTIKGLVWGMGSLFGTGGGAASVKQGNYWGANWFFKNSGITSSMSDAEFVTVLCNYVVDNVAKRYDTQPQYWQGWQNRYKNELNDCLSQLKADGMGWLRLFGQHHFDTMASISQAGFTSSEAVIIATQETYWDALAAASLAGAKNAPILLTNKSSLPSQTASEIKRLGAKTAYVMGGPIAIASSVDDQIKAAGCTTVTRVYGQDQQGTARKIADALGTSRSKTCIIATSNGFQDALSAGPYAYAKKAPIFLTEASGNVLSSETLAAIKSGGYTRVVIAGGPIAVSSSVESQLSSIGISGSSVKRVYGQTEYETSVALAEFSVSEGMSVSSMAIATGTTYWDALTGTALCGKNNSVLVLVSSYNTSAIDTFVKSNKSSVKNGTVFGGEIAVSKAVWQHLMDAMA